MNEETMSAPMTRQYMSASVRLLLPTQSQERAKSEPVKSSTMK
jgi:hypothetical protein